MKKKEFYFLLFLLQILLCYCNTNISTKSTVIKVEIESYNLKDTIQVAKYIKNNDTTFYTFYLADIKVLTNLPKGTIILFSHLEDFPEHANPVNQDLFYRDTIKVLFDTVLLKDIPLYINGPSIFGGFLEFKIQQDLQDSTIVKELELYERDTTSCYQFYDFKDENTLCMTCYKLYPKHYHQELDIVPEWFVGFDSLVIERITNY